MRRGLLLPLVSESRGECLAEGVLVPLLVPVVATDWHCVVVFFAFVVVVVVVVCSVGATSLGVYATPLSILGILASNEEAAVPAALI